MRSALFLIPVLVIPAMAAGTPPPAPDDGRIRPYPANPFYWQYRGKPVLLAGGGSHHNLFNQPETGGWTLEAELNRLAAAGGNYVRNVMSEREGLAARAFARAGDGKFDLNRWNDAYWERFERFLRLTHERDIIVQVELWDPWDLKPDLWGDQLLISSTAR